MTVPARTTRIAMTARGKSSNAKYLLVLLAISVLPSIQAATEAKDAASTSQRFTCAGRTSGYYADVQSDCQKYYMCDSGGRLYSYTCPNQTRFQQRVMICDHWFMVDCSLSANFFSSNLNIGVQGRPFIAGHEQPRRPSHRRPVETSTSYPLRRATSFTPGEPLHKSAKKHTEEKTSKPQVIKNENNAVTKKDNRYFTPPTVEIKQERTLPKEYANNPFFRSLTAATSEAPKLRFNKGHREVLTSPLRKDQANVFDKISDGNNIYFTSTSPPTLETTTVAKFSLSTDHKSNTFSTPLRKPLPNIQETFIAESPLTSRQSFVTPRGHFDQHQDILRNPFPLKFTEDDDVEPPSTVAYDVRPDGFLLTKDLTSHEEELLTNTVELRIPDTRHMFYIADTPTLEAEMLNTNNETVLTIELPSVRHSGAMKFKGTRDAKGRRDACPQCHPAFLLPGRCQPCVLIRR